MRERERNLQFRRIQFHLFEKDPLLLIRIPDCGSAAYTRLNLKEIEKLNRFLDRAEMAIDTLNKKKLQRLSEKK